jgi:hypothetical protein
MQRLILIGSIWKHRIEFPFARCSLTPPTFRNAFGSFDTARLPRDCGLGWLESVEVCELSRRIGSSADTTASNFCSPNIPAVKAATCNASWSRLRYIFSATFALRRSVRRNKQANEPSHTQAYGPFVELKHPTKWKKGF